MTATPELKSIFDQPNHANTRLLYTPAVQRMLVSERCLCVQRRINSTHGVLVRWFTKSGEFQCYCIGAIVTPTPPLSFVWRAIEMHHQTEVRDELSCLTRKKRRAVAVYALLLASVVLHSHTLGILTNPTYNQPPRRQKNPSLVTLNEHTCS